MRLRLTRRLGQNSAGSVLDYRDSEGEWLVSQGHAVPEVRQPDPPAVEAEQQDEESDTTDVGLSRKDLLAKAEGMGLKVYGSKAQLTARIKAAEARAARQ